MTAEITTTESRYGQFTEITLQPDDDVVIRFGAEGSNRAASPNGERGVRVRLDAVAAVGVNGSIALGDALAIDESDVVATWATATAFWLENPLPGYGADSNHYYMRHVATDDVRRIGAYDADLNGVTLTEAFRKILTPAAVNASTDIMTLRPTDWQLLATGDRIQVDALGGFGGLTVGTDYYVIKTTGGATGIKLATSAANAAAGTAIDITGSGTAADVRLDLPVVVENEDAVRLHGEMLIPGGLEIEAGTTASRLHLNDGAQDHIGAHFDLEIRIGTTDEVRRVSEVVDRRIASGQTVSGFSYNAASKEFTAANGNDYRTIETQFALVVADNGGYADLDVGDAFEVSGLAPAARRFKLLDGGNALTLTTTVLNVSAVTVADDSFTIATGDAAKLANLKTGAAIECVAAGGFGGISSEGDYFLIRTATATVFKLASSRANAEAGTAIDITGSGTPSGVRFNSGTPGDIVFSQSRVSFAFELTEAFSSVPATGATVRVVSGVDQGDGRVSVQSATAATTTVIPLVTYDSRISNDHDVEIDGVLRDVADASATAKTITLTTALPAAPKPGDVVEFGHRTSAFFAASALTVAAGATNVAEATVDYPVSGLRFVGTGTGTTRATVRLAGVWLPTAKERV